MRVTSRKLRTHGKLSEKQSKWGARIVGFGVAAYTGLAMVGFPFHGGIVLPIGVPIALVCAWTAIIALS